MKEGLGSLYVSFADVTVATSIVGTRFLVLGLECPMLGDGYVKWLLVRVGSDVVVGSEGFQGLCQMGEPSYLLEADSCDDDVAVVVMIVIVVDGTNCGRWFLLITTLYSYSSNASLSQRNTCFEITSSTSTPHLA